VAEEDAAKAEALLRTVVGPEPVVRSIGRASLKLLEAVGLSAGEYKQTQITSYGGAHSFGERRFLIMSAAAISGYNLNFASA
jgi:hypothetical protein